MKIRQTSQEIGEVFVSVSNHFEGYAPHTARELARRLGMEVKLPSPAEVHPGAERAQMRLWGESGDQ